LCLINDEPIHITTIVERPHFPIRASPSAAWPPDETSVEASFPERHCSPSAFGLRSITLRAPSVLLSVLYAEHLPLHLPRGTGPAPFSWPRPGCRSFASLSFVRLIRSRFGSNPTTLPRGGAIS